jgi:hypothetical protein
MPRPRKWENDSQRRKAQTDIRKASRQEHSVNFISVDGEGMGKWRNHTYCLLGVGESQIEGTLPFTRIASHLYDSYRQEPKAAYVGFFLGYDFTQWFKTLPEHRARMLLTEEGRQSRRRRKYPQLGPFPVEYEGFEFDILGMKRFKIRETGEGNGWMYVCDAGPFFQASLMKVINPKGWADPVVTEEEYAILEEGKKKRDSANLDSRMREYNRLENIILARLMCRLNTGLTKAGIRLKKNQWFGPGQAAQSWLSQIQAPTGDVVREAVTRNRTVRMPQEREPVTGVLDAGRASYYGGWFEIMAHGHIPGIAWEYDINSAYPHIISRLPCLAHGTWESSGPVARRRNGTDSLVLVHATIAGSNARIGTMLHRCDDHSIRRPHRTRGWYWQHELSAAIRAGLIDTLEVSEGWKYNPCDCPPPMRGIAGLYDERLRVGKNTSQGKALKLVYNSVYGKFAQSVGEPKYGNAFYASLITSGCRTMILDAIATHPEGSHGVLMVATDGVYFTSRHSALPVSNRLGEWEETNHSGLTLFKPGVYWTDKTREAIAKGDDPSFKARGIAAKEFAQQLGAIDDHYKQWPELYPLERDPEGPREGWHPSITFKSGFSMITCQQALQRGKWFLAGAVGTQELTQDADPILKRHSGYYEGGIYWSRPYKDGGPHLESVAYDRRFGQPDPDEYGINEDGTVKDQWAEALKGG